MVPFWATLYIELLVMSQTDHTMTALHALHATRSSHEKAVCPSVCLSTRPSVCQMRDL